jgi:carboxyl-terminal processing protease
MKKFIFALTLALIPLFTEAKAITSGDQKFADAEKNFNAVVETILEKYVDKKISREDLYRAATAGMLDSLNPGEQTWNKLLSPSDFNEIKADLAGQISGIGVELKFDTNSGYAQILRVIPKSPGETAGLKTDDQILSVDGTKFKGKTFRDLVASVRGKLGATVNLKVLREDSILNVSVKRQAIAWTPVELTRLDETTSLLEIGYFNQETPKLVERKINELNQSKTKHLIVDLRENSGGGFEQAVQVAELFVAKNSVVASTVDRNEKNTKFFSSKGLLSGNIQVTVLTNGGTYCGAELVAAALREARNAKLIGETTSGKWNAQTIETLSNGFAIKYTVESFQSPKGHSFQDVGLKPDLEVFLTKNVEARELHFIADLNKRLKADNQLKAAYEYVRAM